MSNFWHPFGQLYQASHSAVVFDRGEGVYVYDEDGRRYLDGTAALWYANVGHGRTEIAEAIAAQARKLAGYSTFGNFTNRPAEELAGFLSERAPMAHAQIFFVQGGGDAVETATKLARRYHFELGQPERTAIISRVNGYHGTWGFGTSVGGIDANRQGFGDLVPDTYRVPYDDVEAVEAEIVRLGDERVAAVIAEPVIGAGGVYPPPPGYFGALREICDRHGVLLIADSVICGFGRLGSWFGVERFEISPDLVTFAKGVTSGYLPLGGVAIAEHVAAPFAREDSPIFRHGPTYGGHPTCMAAGLANCHILEDEGILERGALLEGELLASLKPAEKFESVSEVRGGVGLLAAVEVAPDLRAKDPGAVDRLAGTVRRNGLITRVLSQGLAFSPPLIVEPTQLEELGQIVVESLREWEATAG
ncbi:MAG: aminotransferase family protein [Ferrimicrobium sp.]|uniref:aminotransferase family protein n=1 Tax=Ferrimicrobium sp. TaxID=2926050 RepID=UPI0026119114|nr:aminotransferase class III-fold pyridoxal phosphate-dependent enzyme [Ferrimicrobium sp.]MCL5973722.1 aminotransferase class III-fold pyridoxal phosphate-dependent enzyme [Actinomycetota bacterium]